MRLFFNLIFSFRKFTLLIPRGSGVGLMMWFQLWKTTLVFACCYERGPLRMQQGRKMREKCRTILMISVRIFDNISRLVGKWIAICSGRKGWSFCIYKYLNLVWIICRKDGMYRWGRGQGRGGMFLLAVLLLISLINHSFLHFVPFPLSSTIFLSIDCAIISFSLLQRSRNIYIHIRHFRAL